MVALKTANNFSEVTFGNIGAGESQFSTCDVYVFGSNSSSQLAYGSTDKLLKATPAKNMANCHVVSTYMHVQYVPKKP